MKIVSITRGKTINVGNYQSEKIELTAEPTNAQTPEQLLGELDMALVHIEHQILKKYGK